MRRVSKLILCVGVLVLVSSATAWGVSIGVGTDTARIKVDNELVAGGAYPLPSFKIGNTGTDSMGYVLKVAPIDGSDPIPAAWVTFEPDAAYLKAAQWVDVKATINVPADAAPGTYGALLAASPKLPEGMASAKVNVGAGPKVEIKVIAGSPTRATVWRAKRWFAATQPWSAIGLVAAGLAVVGVVLWLVLRLRGRQRIAG
jgi:hypothetical protein